MDERVCSHTFSFVVSGKKRSVNHNKIISKGGHFMNKWRIICSRDAVEIDYEEIISSEAEPDFWTCHEIAEKHGCAFFDVNMVEE